MDARNDFLPLAKEERRFEVFFFSPASAKALTAALFELFFPPLFLTTPAYLTKRTMRRAASSLRRAASAAALSTPPAGSTGAHSAALPSRSSPYVCLRCALSATCRVAK